MNSDILTSLILDLDWSLSDDGWIHFPNEEKGIVWIPPQFRKNICAENTLLVISKDGPNRVLLEDCVYGGNWAQCFAGEE